MHPVCSIVAPVAMMSKPKWLLTMSQKPTQGGQVSRIMRLDFNEWP